VIVLGNGLTGSTSVTFNGVPATFTVKADTYITATVPAGATTGTVSVVTPSGTLNSNPQFVVTK
ncbi:MAG TPA: IPT/TIG domain-containing protein, partial [Candidatus Sulfotelmatobacter sp.]|nr:IPT/TIG domain-containing protein [Candidatus Sulfotelmatobacter sp.]